MEPGGGGGGAKRAGWLQWQQTCAARARRERAQESREAARLACAWPAVRPFCRGGIWPITTLPVGRSLYRPGPHLAQLQDVGI